MRDHVRYLSRGKVHTVEGFDPKQTLLDHIRLTRQATGTKEGCNEGDCGACTVVLGRLRNDAVVYEPVNACIMLTGMVDGCELITIEDLGAPGGLHPVQEAMVALHGSQCGFCTPGIVMSLTALWLSHDEAPPKARIEEALAGNLCRCTGYGPIIAALGRAYEIAAPADDALRRQRATIAA